jgi:hypothetical protein
MASDQTITQYDPHMGETATLVTTNEGDEVDFENAKNVSGDEFAGGTPASAHDYIKAAVEVFKNTNEREYRLSELDSFEQVMVGVMVRMFKLMQEKQRGYGKSNISKAGLHGLFTRATDKIERAKNIVGDPIEQIEIIQKLAEKLPDDASDFELAQFANNVENLVNPQKFAEESIEDTLIDLANYGLIMYMVQSDSWGFDMEENQ